MGTGAVTDFEDVVSAIRQRAKARGVRVRDFPRDEANEIAARMAYRDAGGSPPWKSLDRETRERWRAGIGDVMKWFADGERLKRKEQDG